MTIEFIFGLFVFFCLVCVFDYVKYTPDFKSNLKSRWIVNIILFVMSNAIKTIVPVSVFSVSVYFQDSGIEIVNFVSLEGYVLAGILVMSASGYFLHMICHKVPILWRFHQIHHSDFLVDATTTFRSHPFMFFISSTFYASVVVLFGVPPEAVFIQSLIAFTLSCLHHSHVIWPEVLERGLGWLIMTPMRHKLHHSTFQPETDSNYSNDLILWDYVFGTLKDRSLSQRGGFELGLDYIDQKKSTDLDYLLLLPFRKK